MEEEITLRDLIEILLKGKWIIAIAMVVMIVVSGIGSFVFIKPSYSATTVLLTNPIKGSQDDSKSNDVTQMINNFGKIPNMTVETYKEQFINPTVLNETINELKLVDSNENPITRSSLTSKISVSIIPNTNSIKVLVSDGNAEKAAIIANTLSKNFINYISDNTRKLREEATSEIETQMNNEKEKLEEQTKILQDYLKNSPNVDQMKLQVSSLNDQITSYQSQLNDVEKQISTDKDTLDVLTNGNYSTTVGNAPANNVKINVPIDGSSKTSQKLQLDINNSSELKNSLITVKITEVETRLVENIAQQSSLINKIKDMESQVEDLQSTLAEEQYKYDAIQRSYNLAGQTYNAYLDRYNEAVIAAISNNSQSAIIVSSPAETPMRPSGHGRMYYIAFGGFLGFMLGIFIVLFRGYWNLSDPRKSVNNK